MRRPFLALMAFGALLLSGCISGSSDGLEGPDDSDSSDAYADGQLFVLTSCEGVELAQEWLGPHGPNGPQQPPASWEDIYTKHQFSWSLEMLECSRLGWGPLERGSVALAMEVHNAYAAPEACMVGLDETFFPRYLHQVYVDDSEVAEYAASWGMPVRVAEFSRGSGLLDSIVLRLGPADAAPSTMDVHRTGPFEGDATDINVAFFWFEGEQVHRLTLHRETRTTVGDVAVLDMAPPSIMGDRPNPQVATASWLTDLQWVGDLVTFSDVECTEQVFP